MAMGSVLGSILLPFEIAAPYAGAVLGLCLLWLGLRYGSKKRRSFLAVDSESIIKHLECSYAHMKTSIWDELQREEQIPKELRHSQLRFQGRGLPEGGWHEIISKEVKSIKAQFSTKMFKQASFIFILAGILTAIIFLFPHIIYPSTKHALSWIPAFGYHNTLTIERGMIDMDKPMRVELNASSPPTIRVTQNNLVKLDIHSLPAKTYLSLGLSKLGNIEGSHDQVLKDYMNNNRNNNKSRVALYQSFRMEQITKKKHLSMFYERFHTLKFHVDTHVSLWIPEIDEHRPLAHIEVLNEPLPEVGLVALTPINPEKSWHDEDPLPLKISAVSEYPLKQLKLIIQNGERISEELVTHIMAKDQTSLTHDYYFDFTPYMRSGEEHFHITAKASAQRGDKQLLGYSETLEITASSSYGRYQQTLAYLSDLRDQLLELMGSESSQEQQENITMIEELLDKTQEISASSSFFDHYDRFFLEDLAKQLDSTTLKQADYAVLAKQVEQLTSFLQGHEALNDRQRDRDFFVATRAIGSLLEKPKYHQKLIQASDDMKVYLKNREERWQQRVSKVLPSLRPERATEITEKGYFSTSWLKLSQSWDSEKLPLNKLKKSAREIEVLRSKESLQTMVMEYRQWITNLEAAEEASKNRIRKKHYKVMNQAENTLLMLQKRQDGIARSLDISSYDNSQESTDQPIEDWNVIAKRQQKNLMESQVVIAQLSAIPGLSTHRLSSASQSMIDVLSAGARQDFITAEEQADLAARLLREGRSETRRHREHQSQQQARMSEMKQRSRKRVIGSNYFGHEMADLSLDQDHAVDPKYREKILEDVSKQKEVSDDDKQVLMRYLREMLR